MLLLWKRVLARSRLPVVAVIGDNSTDTEEDARWTLGPRAPMGTDGWVGGTHTGSTGGSASTQTRRGRGREREITQPLVILHIALLLSLSLCFFPSRQLTLWIRTSGHLYAWLCMSLRSWMRASTCILCMHRARSSSGWVSRLRTRPHKCTEGKKYVLWFTVYVKNCSFLKSWNTSLSACCSAHEQLASVLRSTVFCVFCFFLLFKTSAHWLQLLRGGLAQNKLKKKKCCRLLNFSISMGVRR